jgi:hypothetical protein
MKQNELKMQRFKRNETNHRSKDSNEIKQNERKIGNKTN